MPLASVLAFASPVSRLLSLSASRYTVTFASPLSPASCTPSPSVSLNFMTLMVFVAAAAGVLLLVEPPPPPPPEPPTLTGPLPELPVGTLLPKLLSVELLPLIIDTLYPRLPPAHDTTDEGAVCT